MSDPKPFADYLSEVLVRAEEDLNEGDYLTLANALKDAHKKSNDGKPPRTPYIYFPINITLALTECSGGIQSAFITLNEVGGNNLTSPYPTILHIKGTIDITYEDKVERKDLECYSSDSTNTIIKVVQYIEPKTIESNIFNIKRIDKYEDWKKTRSRYKTLDAFWSDIIEKAYGQAHTMLWNKVNHQRGSGVIGLSRI